MNRITKIIYTKFKNTKNFLDENFHNYSITSSLYYPQSNREAERAVKTMKGLLKKKGDPYLALLAYSSMPLPNGYSLEELLMNRKLRTNIPSSKEARKPVVPDRELLAAREGELRQKQKMNFDWHHRARDLSPALPGDLAWVRDRRERGTVGNQVSPRSYRVKTPSGSFRRNRRDIITPLPEENDAKRTPERSDAQTGSNVGRSTPPSSSPCRSTLPRRSTRITYQPDRYNLCAR